MKKLVSIALALLALLAATAPASAQQVMAWSLYNYDVSAAAYTYCVMKGQNGDPFGEPLIGPAQVTTVGSSTTVTEKVASTNPFTNLAVGDMLIVRRGEVTDRVSITAKASAASITVSSAVNWSAGLDFRWLDLNCGTAVTDGWVGVGTFSTVGFTVEWVTKNATSLEFQTECAIGPGQPGILETRSVTAIGNYGPTLTAGVYDRCRLGIKLSTDTGVQSVNAHIEVKK
jgi:hypothetical protein